MAPIYQFEQLTAWQTARQMAKAIYNVTQQGAFAKDYGLAGQIQRSAVSVMSNIAEGCERSTTRELLHFLSIAKSSCAEVRSQLYVALDVGYIAPSEFERLGEHTNETGRIINGLMRSLKSKLSDQ